MTGLIIISLTAILILFLGLYRAQKAIIPVSVLGLSAALFFSINDWDTNLYYFNQMVLMDNFAIAFGALVIVSTLLILISSKGYFERISTNVAEYVSLILFALVGVLAMVSYQNLSMLFIGIEIMSICLYVLAGIRKKDLNSNEAALKYFLMGCFATGVLLFGIALVYGGTGTFDIEKIGQELRLSNGVISPLFYMGVLLILMGLLFKISAAPFHFWAPDVYDGSPSLITSFMASVVKTAGIAAFLRLFFISFSSISGFLTPTLWTVIVLSLLVGNVIAVYQSNLKRMLAYSSISHAGYMLFAILAMSEDSARAVFMYALAYSFATIVAFTIFIKVKENKGSDQIDIFNGLGKRNPFLAFAMTVAMCSFAGIPLTAGFFAKFYMFTIALAQQYTWLVVIGILSAIIGIYYYFKVIIAMYMKESETEEKVSLDLNTRIVLILGTAALLVFGIMPELIASIL